MSVRALSQFNDRFCDLCGDPAAEGAAVDGTFMCRPHAQHAIFSRAEAALFDVLRNCDRAMLDEIIESVTSHTSNGPPNFGYVA